MFDSKLWVGMPIWLDYLNNPFISVKNWIGKENVNSQLIKTNSIVMCALQTLDLQLHKLYELFSEHNLLSIDYDIMIAQT